MFRYPYVSTGQGTPPAPFVLVHISADDPAGGVHDLPALADTGADQTVIPARLVDRLGLVPLDRVLVTGFGGVPEVRNTYQVRLVVRDLPPVDVEVITGWSDDHAVLGRDVLNRYKIVLDGPNLRLEISDA